MGDNTEEERGGPSKKTKKDKRLSVERIYQKKSQVEHVLLRPDTYIGSVEFTTQHMWVYDGEECGMVFREITFVPGLYKIFDEILVNAADNKQRDKSMDCIKVDIDTEKNTISVWNNGRGIPIIEHEKEKMFVPTLIFGCLLTSSNYNDDEKKVTGGRNGYGAKLCNIFSESFIVETSSKESKRRFKQTWKNNMAETGNPKMEACSSEDFTCVTFRPDLLKFNMEVLDKDIVALMSRRAYDVAGCSRGVKVFLNGKGLPVKNFKDYIDQCLKGKTDDDGSPLRVVYENVNDRWEVGVAQSTKGYQQISFVNSIATTKGGRHVDYIADQILSKVADSVKKRNKAGIQVKPFQIKNHMWLFVNCLIENPTFDSQTKENMTREAKNFGSKCTLSEKFFSQVNKCGIVESVMNWVKFKAQTQLNKKCHSTKHSKLKGIPKLEDANDAGSKNSMDCTLILTEGDSAKTLAVSGLGVVGRDKFGIFPLRGKMLNVREASHKQILENAEINNVIKIMGLQYKKAYESVDDLRSLRYGRLMIMTDQDQDGSHIKGLLINFIHHNWPSLLRLPFLEEFITPIVKATKSKKELSFYSLPEFEEWKAQTAKWNTWKIKYYKGLGTSTSKEAKEYFLDMVRHRIKFHYRGSEDDDAIQLAFSKKMIDQRKEWLTNAMDERKRRRELGLPEVYLYGKDTKTVTFNDFVNKELILFSNMDNERSIPSLVDGLKPGQRKVIYTCLKRNDKREVKVAQLAGSVAEHSAYHHGEVSLMSTIINLAQNYVGSNNINLLQPIGQFGTRLQGGKDSASPRYIFTMLSPLAKLILNPLDAPLLTHLYDDNQCIEPEFYVPILPMVLVNGAEGIGTGWSTKIPNYNPRDIVNNLRGMMAGNDPVPMIPWFKNFCGTIENLDHQRYVVNGEMAKLDGGRLEITELPVRTWTQNYKEGVLESMLHGTENSPPLITDYREYNTDTTIRFVVHMTEEKLLASEKQGLHKLFKLQTSLTTSSMVLFDSSGCLRKYETPEDILREFFNIRSTFYERRKTYLVGMLNAEAKLLSNQARFILEKCDGIIIIENKKKTIVVKMLVDRGFDSDPVRAWRKTAQMNQQGIEDEQNSEEMDEEQKEDDQNRPNFDYLMGMPMWSLTIERKEELLRKKDQKISELETLKSKSPLDLWEEDLSEFLQELDRVEEKEREEQLVGFSDKKTNAPERKLKSVKKKVTKTAIDPNMPLAGNGQRVTPIINPEIRNRKKVKVDRPARSSKAETDSDVAPLAKRIGASPQLLKKAFGKRSNNLSRSKSVSTPRDHEVEQSQQNIALEVTEAIQHKRKVKPSKVKKLSWDSDSDTYTEERSWKITEDNADSLQSLTFNRPKRCTVRKTYVYDMDSDDLEGPSDSSESIVPPEVTAIAGPSGQAKSSNANDGHKEREIKRPRKGFAAAVGLLWSSDSDEQSNETPSTKLTGKKSEDDALRRPLKSCENQQTLEQTSKTKSKRLRTTSPCSGDLKATDARANNSRAVPVIKGSKSSVSKTRSHKRI